MNFRHEVQMMAIWDLSRVVQFRSYRPRWVLSDSGRRWMVGQR